MIEGVWVVPLEVHCDDRGYLFEIARRKASPEAHGVIHKFGQVYLVGDMARGTIRAFHKHREVWDWFCIGHGSAKAVLIDDREGSPSYGERMTVVLGDRKPVLIAVPPGVYHGWMSLEDDTQLIGIASEMYDPQSPDEVRVPPDHFGDVWTIQGR